MSEKSSYFYQLDKLQAVAVSTLDSPMFHMKPINTQLNSNETYQYTFSYESLFDDKQYADSWAQWMTDNWRISIASSLLYMILVASGRKYMQGRPKYELRRFLILWNIILAVFSILGTIRVWPDFIRTLAKHGVVHSVCDNSYAYGITGFWSLMFVLSKLPELIDTMFIVLRKQELIFLHWYHHATVLIYCWYSYKDFTASGRWFMSMNYLVHGLMYSYYACKAMRVKVPRFISQLITTGQIVQMVAGIYVNYVAYTNRPNCHNSDENIMYSSLMYFSYFLLFMNFFLNAYVFKKRSDSQSAQPLSSNRKTDENNNNVVNKSKAKKIN